MKDVYYLPWNCNTSKKIKKVLGWIVLIGSPLMMVIGIITINGFLIGLGFIFSFMAWVSADMYDFINFPSIKCKPMDSISKESTQ